MVGSRLIQFIAKSPTLRTEDSRAVGAWVEAHQNEMYQLNEAEHKAVLESNKIFRNQQLEFDKLRKFQSQVKERSRNYFLQQNKIFSTVKGQKKSYKSVVYRRKVPQVVLPQVRPSSPCHSESSSSPLVVDSDTKSEDRLCEPQTARSSSEQSLPVRVKSSECQTDKLPSTPPRSSLPSQTINQTPSATTKLPETVQSEKRTVHVQTLLKVVSTDKPLGRREIEMQILRHVEKIRTLKKFERSVEDLKTEIQEHLTQLSVDISPLCQCRRNVWDMRPDGCLPSCKYYNNSQAYLQGLVDKLKKLP